MDRGAHSGGSSKRPAWSGRAKPRNAAEPSQPVAIRTARKSATIQISDSDEEDTHSDDSVERRVLRSRSISMPPMKSSRPKFMDSSEEDLGSDSQDADDEAKGSQSPEENSQQEHRSTDSAEKEPPETLQKEKDISEQKVHKTAEESKPTRCEEDKLSNPNVVHSLKSKLERFVKAGTGFIDEIDRMQRRPGDAVMDVAREMVTKSFRHSERLVHALLALQPDAHSEKEESKIAILPEQMPVASVAKSPAKKRRSVS